MASTAGVESIMDSIKTKLWASALYTAIGGRIGVGRIAADSALPCCVYSVSTSTVQRFMGNQERYDLEIEFTFYDSAKSDTSTIHELAKTLGTSLAGSYSVNNLDRITIVRMTAGAPSFDDECWSITEKYKVTAFKL
jgi:hypothetical protein